jgi:cellulose synthase operon protein YhjQ
VEEAIRLHWERFLREVNARQEEGLKSGVGFPPDPAPLENTTFTVWQRVQNPAASPSNLAALSNTGVVMPNVSASADLPEKPASSGDRLPLEMPRRNSADALATPALPKAPSGDRRLEPDHKSEAEDKTGGYSMRLHWTGSGFEERRVPVESTPADSATPEPQHPARFEAMSEGSPSFTHAGSEMDSTQHRMQQKMGQARVERCVPIHLQAQTKDAQSPKNNDVGLQAGHIRYDPIQGIWIRTQPTPSLPSKPEAPPDSDVVGPPAGVAFEQPQQKASRANALLRLASWFRTEPEDRQVSVTPAPEEVPAAESQPAAIGQCASAMPSSTDAQDSPAPNPNVETLEEHASHPAAALTVPEDMVAPSAQAGAMHDSLSETAPPLPATPDLAAPGAQTASLAQSTAQVGPSSASAQEMPVPFAQAGEASKDAYLPVPSLAVAQDLTAPTEQIALVDRNDFVPVPSSAPDKYLGGIMWQSVTDAGVAASKAAPSAGEKPHTVHDGEKSRWFVLNGVLGGAPVTAEPSVPEAAGDVPVLEVFSLAGGVGKTSLVATLGRALSARGERVLVIEATPFESLQYYFGECNCRPGVIRTFRPPSRSSDAPIRLASIDSEALLRESALQGSLASDVKSWAQGSSRVIVDVGTGSTAAVRGLSRMSTLVLVPLIPDVNSVVTAHSIDTFFERLAGPSGRPPNVFYVLNQFDSSLPLHVDVRKGMQARLGKRLLPIALPRTPAVSEALAEGMTIMDYAPDSMAAAEFTSLAKWLADVQAPAALSSHGRWSER